MDDVGIVGILSVLYGLMNIGNSAKEVIKTIAVSAMMPILKYTSKSPYFHIRVYIIMERCSLVCVFRGEIRKEERLKHGFITEKIGCSLELVGTFFRYFWQG